MLLPVSIVVGSAPRKIFAEFLPQSAATHKVQTSGRVGAVVAENIVNKSFDSVHFDWLVFVGIFLGQTITYMSCGSIDFEKI